MEVPNGNVLFFKGYLRPSLALAALIAKHT